MRDQHASGDLSVIDRSLSGVGVHQNQMADPQLPPEILDYIIDFVRDEPQTLEICCLVAKSWVSRARKRLFSEIKIASLTHLEAWWRVFPDPDSSPGCYARCLIFISVGYIPSVVARGCGLVRPFSNVVRLNMWDGKSILRDRLTSHWFPNPRRFCTPRP